MATPNIYRIPVDVVNVSSHGWCPGAMAVMLKLVFMAMRIIAICSVTGVGVALFGRRQVGVAPPVYGCQRV